MSKFKIYPAIDMSGGNCVRLFQGDYKKKRCTEILRLTWPDSLQVKAPNGFIWLT